MSKRNSQNGREREHKDGKENEKSRSGCKAMKSPQ